MKVPCHMQVKSKPKIAPVLEIISNLKLEYLDKLKKYVLSRIQCTNCYTAINVDNEITFKLSVNLSPS